MPVQDEKLGKSGSYDPDTAGSARYPGADDLSPGWGDRISAAAKRIGDRSAAALAMGVSPDSLTRYATEKVQPTFNAMWRLAAAARVDLHWIASGRGAMDARPYGDVRDEVGADFALVPMLDVKAAAGSGNDVHSEDLVARFAFRRDWLRRRGLTIAQLALITATGDSMQPTIHDGDVLLVHTVSRFEGDGIYVLRADSGLLVKRLQRLPGGTVRVRSDNPAYEPFEVPLQALEETPVDREFSLVGRVAWAGGEK
jgi:phage repressor protein C with HTH and peptisase S24 domain